MGEVNGGNVQTVFTYHTATQEQELKFRAVRDAVIHLAQTILNNVPDCADRTSAIRKLRECRMDANAAIALDGLI
jgi:hypothetical protein